MNQLSLLGTNLLASAEAGGEIEPSFWGMMVNFALVLGIIFGLMAMAKKGLNEKYFTNRWTQRFEHLYIFLENLVVGIIGSHGRKYLPIVMVFWMVIFVGNVYGLFFPSTITSDLSFNLALALMAIGYVQHCGIMSNGGYNAKGIFGHLSHFAGPKMAGPLILINVMLFCIELVSELMKNVSLSLRLYGNMHGGHKAAESMNALGSGVINLGSMKLSIPFGAFLIPVKMLTCVVQAMIFCLLMCVYISLVTHNDHEESHDDGLDLIPAH